MGAWLWDGWPTDIGSVVRLGFAFTVTLSVVPHYWQTIHHHLREQCVSRDMSICAPALFRQIAGHPRVHMRMGNGCMDANARGVCIGEGKRRTNHGRDAQQAKKCRDGKKNPGRDVARYMHARLL